jgi:hypothetical protein
MPSSSTDSIYRGSHVVPPLNVSSKVCFVPVKKPCFGLEPVNAISRSTVLRSTGSSTCKRQYLGPILGSYAAEAQSKKVLAQILARIEAPVQIPLILGVWAYLMSTVTTTDIGWRPCQQLIFRGVSTIQLHYSKLSSLRSTPVCCCIRKEDTCDNNVQQQRSK